MHSTSDAETPSSDPLASELLSGDRLPEMVVAPPGPRSRQLSQRARRAEAPGINTLYNDHDNIFWQQAKGSNVLDVDGNLYLDFTSGFGVAAIGHRHRAVEAALRHQGERLIHGLGDAMGHAVRVELAERLQAIAPVDDAKVYFAISGADAVEVAIKTMLLATGRRRLLVFSPSYHGLTLGALAASSRPAFRQPFAAHLHRHLHRLPFGCSMQQVDEQLAQGDFAGVLVEPIVGREGVLFPPVGWLRDMADRCRHHRVPLAVDEIFTGFGRTGSLFAVDYDRVRPDLLLCGKALAGGLPIGAVIARRSLLEAWRVPGEALHTATFVANPLACAAALATLDVIERDDLVATSQRLGSIIGRGLEPLKERFPAVIDIRGRGMLWGIELQHPDQASMLTQFLLEQGLIALAGGANGCVLQWVPPLTITSEQLQWALETLPAQLQRISTTGPLC